MDIAFHPFKNQNPGKREGKEKAKDPLDVRGLLTDSSRKALVTPEGKLKFKHEENGKDGIELMKERYWGASYQALFHKQLALESRNMREKFPHFELRKAEKPFLKRGWLVADTGALFWIGSLKTHTEVSYLVATAYPTDYPFGEIKAYVLDPYIPATEHRFQDGHLCLYDHEGKGGAFEGSKSTAITIVAWTAAWLHAYEIWCKTGKWPVLEGKK